MNLLLPLILAAVVTMALIPLLERRAKAMHVLDEPGERKVHERAMPRVGGIAIAVGVLLPLVLWLPMERPLVAALLGALVVFLFGVWDDRRNLSRA
jgi:UDP-GlcNAc:undecaprenyl-phosphate/decaprenyl-phosphate GlcNAc-1-phosphate transferase